MADVGTTAETLGNGPALVQNLGPDILYVGGSGVSNTTGFKLNPGESVAMLFSNANVFVISEGTSDVRVLYGGTGVFLAPAATP